SGAAQATSAIAEIEAIALQLPRSRADDRQCGVEPEPVDQRAAAVGVAAGVVELDPVRLAGGVEEGGRERHVALRGVALGDAADMLVDAVDLLHHHQPAARGGDRVGAPGADPAGWRVQDDVATHWRLPGKTVQDPDSSAAIIRGRLALPCRVE